MSVPVKVTTRAAWMVVHPRSPHVVAVDSKWTEGLPASCEIAAGDGKARLELTGPRQAPLDAPVSIMLTVDNTHGTKTLSGSIILQGHGTSFSASAGKTAHVDLSLPGGKGGTARVSWYTIRVADRIVGRGGFTLVDEQAAASVPAIKTP